MQMPSSVVEQFRKGFLRSTAAAVRVGFIFGGELMVTVAQKLSVVAIAIVFEENDSKDMFGIIREQKCCIVCR